MRCRRWAVAALALMPLASCTLAERDATRFAVAGGFRRSDVGGDGDSYSQLTIATDEGPSGFVEVSLEDGDQVLAIRMTGARDRHAVAQGVREATFDQVLWLMMYGRRLELSEQVRLVMLFGLGVGWSSLDFGDELGLSPRTGANLAISGGVELEFWRRTFVGAMGWSGAAGYPGDTEGSFEAVMVYAGVRF